MLLRVFLGPGGAFSGLGGEIEPKSIRTLAGRKILKATAPSLTPRSEFTPRSRLPSCPACGTGGPVGHIVGPCPGLNRALQGAEQGARQTGPANPPAIVRKQQKNNKKTAAHLVSTGRRKCFTLLFNVLCVSSLAV